MSKILALVPARKDSKSIPLKNLREMGGKPLLAWSIEAALGACAEMRVVCSTDDPEIARVATECGAEAPFLRPEALATDEAQTIDVVLHALDWLGESFSHVVLLQPTAPLRASADIDGALKLAMDERADAVVSVTDSSSHPYLTYTLSERLTMTPFCATRGPSLRRQDLPPAYVLNGAVYVSRVESLARERTFLPPGALAYWMPRERSIDIDHWSEWKLAEILLMERG